jgi:hypothetical protein
MLKYEYRAAGYTPSGQLATLTGTIDAGCDEAAWNALVGMKNTWNFTKLNFIGLYSLDKSGERSRTPLIYESTPGTVAVRRDMNKNLPVVATPIYTPPPKLGDLYANAPWTRDFETSKLFNTVKIKDKRSTI